MPEVKFLFDFGSPNAYLSHKVIPQIEARTGVRFAYAPILPADRTAPLRLPDWLHKTGGDEVVSFAAEEG